MTIYSLLPRQTSLDEQYDDTVSTQHLDYDLTGSKSRKSVSGALVLFRAYYWILHILVLVLVGTQWSNMYQETGSVLPQGTTWCKFTYIWVFWDGSNA